MRVVFLRSNPVNPDSRVEKEVNSLVKNGYQVDILAWDRSEKYSIRESFLNLTEGKVRIHRLGIPATFGGGIKKNLRPLLMFQIKLFTWLYKNKDNYDIIHACDFDTAYTAFKFAKIFKKIFIYDIFDYYVDAFSVPNFIKVFIEKRDHKIINSADSVIICTEQRKEQIKGTNPKQLAIIHNTPPKLKNKINRLDLDENKIKIVYVGILDNGRFIKEIVDIVKSDANLELHIGGFGKYETYLQKVAKKYNNIIFYGKIPYMSTLELEDSCDIMTAIYDPEIPNNFYAAPNKFYEALMLGKPLIMVKNTGMDWVVSENNIGEVIEFTKESLEKAVESLISRKKEWEDMSMRMKKIYDEKFSWDQMEKRLFELYSNFE